MRNPQLPEWMKFSHYVMPVDSNAQAQGGNYNFTSLRNYINAGVLLAVGAHSGSAAAVTLQQAKNVEGNGSKALGFTRYYNIGVTQSPVTNEDRWNQVDAASNTFNIVAQTLYYIPIRRAMLDVTNNFDCVRFVLAAPDAATLIFAQLMLYGGPEGKAGDTDLIPSARVNRMPN